MIRINIYTVYLCRGRLGEAKNNCETVNVLSYDSPTAKL